MQTLLRIVFVLGFCVPVLAGCGGSGSSAEPPSGWEQEGDRWWAADLDTTGIFRNMDSFESMGISIPEVVYGQGRETQAEVLVNTVRQRLLPMYRNHPHIVDSLFGKYAAPQIKKAAMEAGDPDDKVEQQVRKAYTTIVKHFREPRTESVVGEDVPISRPDSLQGISGDVDMQVYVDAEGRTQAVEIIESVHPVLDRISMRAATETKWSPAYLHGEPIPAWARFSIGFN